MNVATSDTGAVGSAPSGRRPVPPDGLPRLLPAHGEQLTELAGYLRRHGPLPTLARVRRDRHPLIGVVERAGLTGRGGGGFPTARKLAAVAERRGPAVVVVNAVEAEPVSAKDKTLCGLVPHLVIDGAEAAADAVGARRIVIVAHRSVAPILSGAVRARSGAGVDRVPVEVVVAADHFVAGEESAVVNWIERGISKPTIAPPRPFEQGVERRPTLINNAETLAHLALIVRYGEDWFRSLGTPAEPGTILVTARGGVRRPGVYEAALGTPVGDIVQAAGGAAEAPAAYLVGGYFGTWVGAQVEREPFSRAGLARYGASVGAGLLLVMPTTCCGVVETARLSRYLAGQSAGQCGPCVFGLRAISDELVRLARGAAAPDSLSKLRRWLGEVEGRGACAHPDGVVRLVRSALELFHDEVEWHAAGRCSAPHPEQSILDLPNVTLE